MKCKKNKLTAIFIAVFYITLVLINFNLNCYAYEEGENKEILFVYNENKYLNDAEIFNFLKAFIINCSDSCDYVKIENLNLKDINNYSYIIVYDVDSYLINGKIIESLKIFKGNIYWIGDGIDKFLNCEDDLKFDIQSISSNKMICNNDEKDSFFVNAEFENVCFVSSRYNLNNNNKQDNTCKSITNNTNAKWKKNLYKVYGWVSDGTRNYNYLVKYKNTWYVPYIPKEKAFRHLVTDSLNEFLNIKREKKPKVYLFLEEKDKSNKQLDIKIIKEYLENEHIPFISDRTDFSEALPKGLEDFPYDIRDKSNGKKIICTNLVDFNTKDKMYIKKLEENYRMLSLVQGFDAKINLTSIKEINRIRDTVSFLKSKDVSFQSSEKPQNNNEEDIENSNSKNKYISKINNIFIFIVGGFCIIFTIVFLKYRKINKNKFYR